MDDSLSSAASNQAFSNAFDDIINKDQLSILLRFLVHFARAALHYDVIHRLDHQFDMDRPGDE